MLIVRWRYENDDEDRLRTEAFDTKAQAHRWIKHMCKPIQGDTRALIVDASTGIKVPAACKAATAGSPSRQHATKKTPAQREREARGSASAFDQETYEDALGWSPDRIEREMTAISDYMTTHWRLMSEENKQTLLREREAIRKAQRERLRAGSHARKKKPPAQLQREIDEALRKSTLPGITDTFRRTDIGPTATTPRKPRRPRVMFAVVSEGPDRTLRDLGAYATRARAQSEADKFPDAYVVETLRAP